MIILRSQIFEIILTVIINFLSDLSWSMVYMVMLFYEVSEKTLEIITFSFLLFVFLRLFILPLYYTWLEKRTQNEAIKNFIQKLRYNFITKIFMIFPVAYMITILCNKLINRHLHIEMFAIIPFIIISILLGAMGNYLFLFFYWFVVDLYKKKKQKNKKN